MSCLDTTTEEAAAARASAGRLLLGGFLTFAMVMGIGRFIYTPLLPLMRDEYGLEPGLLGLLASLNFVGYFVGSAIGIVLARGQPRLWGLRVGVVSSVATTAAMGLTDDIGLWMVWRTLSGVASAVAMLSAAGIVSEALARIEDSGRVGWLFGGVGFGIALSGTLVRLTSDTFDSSGLWLLGAAVCGLMLPVVLAEVRERDLPVRRRAQRRQRRVPRPLPLVPLVVNYTCEGLGYSVFVTFIVAIVKARPGGEVLGDWVWVIVGLSALPACLLWMQAAERIGFATALMLAYTAQVVAVLLPVLSTSGAAAVAAAILFGGTFTAISALTLPLGRHGGGGRGFAILTVFFGMGQIAGPAAAGYMAELSPRFDFSTALVASAGVLILGQVFLAYAMATRRDVGG
ncbi:YbfB/YjiJ family MFS transporter [Lutibaculum baratangense]|uniref:Transporter, MFS superfamily n=1 Tax=Lutibaculum baratangense AMV1 TaxID=631454 RepID=V4R3F3_9HYPH|nr:YbfB/YjiJ family MFS transporter [Lutibaculum baratangense]ESR26452.1 Transporter, MFS superfamily [Lutibaculum baratangense AMV1]